MKKHGARHTIHTVLGLIIVAFMLFPLYWAIVGSLKTNNQIFTIPPALLPPTPTFESYGTALRTELGALLSSVIISTGTVILSLLMSAPAAFALAHFKFRFTAALVVGLLLAQMIPPVILANSLYVIFNTLGLLNRYIGLIIADSSLAIPFSVLILRAFMQSIPHGLPEAARVDGASDMVTFVRIIVPISRSALITAALFTFLFAWGDFLFALTMITKPGKEPITLGLFKFIGDFSQQWNDVMATAVIASIPAAFLLTFAQRYIAAGLLAGSIKE
jgi:multiple sugar transport system permease protein